MRVNVYLAMPIVYLIQIQALAHQIYHVIQLKVVIRVPLDMYLIINIVINAHIRIVIVYNVTIFR